MVKLDNGSCSLRPFGFLREHNCEVLDRSVEPLLLNFSSWNSNAAMLLHFCPHLHNHSMNIKVRDY